MFKGSTASSAYEVKSESPLDDVLSKLREPIKECTDDEQGGGAPDISIEEITILVILFHGTVELTVKQPTCHGHQYCGPTINFSNLSSIDNLAYLALAPTGLSNIGTNHELHAYRTYFEYEIKKKIVESLQKIETKADELVYKNSSISKVLSGICKYCFSYSTDKLSRGVEWLGNLITNYSFTNKFTVCKSVGNTSLSGGNGMNILKGGTKRKRETPKHSLSMSYDMFVLMLNELRLKIKKFDSERVTKLCSEQLSLIDPDKQPELHGYCETLKETLKHINERCRSLHIVKGLGTANLTGFTNKHLSYNPKVDGPTAVDGGKNMGVIKLQFSIDDSGQVECSDKPYDAHEVMKVIAYNKLELEKHHGVYWSTMEACIAHCTEGDDRSKTTFVIDLTCSSLLGAECSLLKESSEYIIYPGGGGGKRIKKKSASMKKTRRIKNKSKSTRYIRNRRNRLKHNKITKRGRKTKTYRKH